MPRVVDWVDPFGVRVKILSRHWPASLRFYIFALEVAWTLFRERANYEIAYFLMTGLHVVTGTLMARLLGKKIVMKFSCSGEIVRMKDSWVGRLEVGLLRRYAASLLVLNPGMVQEALDAGFSREQIGWMPNPIDIDKFSPCSEEERLRFRQELGVSADTPLVVFVGRLVEQKKIPWLLGSFVHVVREQPNAMLAILGDGSLGEEMTQLAMSLGLEKNVLFTGRVSSDGVLKWLRAGDVYTLISAVEGLPCSLIEAMATGIAPVVSDIPAHTQIVDHETHGLITELGNETSVAQGLLRMLRDAELRKRIAVASRERIVRQFSIQHVGDCYEELFANVLGPK